MTAARVVAVTGVSGYWGSRLVARLLAQKGYQVIGLDPEQPAVDMKGLDFIQADVRNPLLAELLRVEQVEQVCHLDFQHSVRPSEAAFDRNVVGTQALLQACLEAGVRKLVLKSSTAVYGARPTNSAFLTEEHSLRGGRRYGSTRDRLEIENICRDFRRRYQEPALTVLRFASIVGPTADTPMTAFLAGSRAPTLLGFDPVMQLIHERDVIEALVHAMHHDRAGVFNVAANDLWPLNSVRGLAGKSPLPMYHRWVAHSLVLLKRNESLLSQYLPVEPEHLQYRCVADLTKMEDELGFLPRYSAEDALRQFAQRRGRRDRHRGSLALAQDEGWLHDVIAQRRQEDRQREAQGPVQRGE